MITNEDLLDKIVKACSLRSTDTVLELGSGTGGLTSRLLPAVRRVYSCDSDEALLNETQRRGEGEGFTNLELLPGDALTVPLPRFDVCVANLPFSLSSPILFRLIRHRPLWRSSVLILQREFVDALIADPGERNYSRLSMNASVFVRTERLHRINGACFYPIPPVESTVVRLTPRNPPPTFDFLEFDALTRTAFIEKKQILKNVFSRPGVLHRLETNYKTYCSFHKIPVSTMPFPKLVESLLESSGLSRYAAKHLPAEAMEHLLQSFHEKGIYFTSIASTPVTPVRSESSTTTSPLMDIIPAKDAPREQVDKEVEEDVIPTVS